METPSKKKKNSRAGTSSKKAEDTWMDVQQRSDCYRSYSRMEIVGRWEKDIWDFCECETSEISGFFAVRLKLERENDPSAAERFVEYYYYDYNLTNF